MLRTYILHLVNNVDELRSLYIQYSLFVLQRVNKKGCGFPFVQPSPCQRIALEPEGVGGWGTDVYVAQWLDRTSVFNSEDPGFHPALAGRGMG